MWEQYVDGGGGVLYDLLARCVNVAPPLFVSFVYVSFEFYVSLKKKNIRWNNLFISIMDRLVKI